MNISTALSSAAEKLAEAGIAEPYRETASLLAFSLQKEAAYLIAHPEYELNPGELSKFEEYVERRAKREPFQYIVGHQEFYGLEFEVTPDVLIPRPETEILVEKGVEYLSRLSEPRLLEIGVGSGCISVAILNAVEQAKAVGVDISQAAMNVARRNAERHNVAARLDLRQGNVFAAINDGSQFDLIVSNPPYVPSDQLDSLQAEVRDFEPRDALDGGSDGLDIVRKIVTGATQRLKPGGFLLVEIGHGQADAVSGLFTEPPWRKSEFLLDLQQIPRVVISQLH
jgi:release factor glutamine methyltransferase